MLHENILLIRDENAFGNIYNELRLSFDRIEVTVRDIITERVYQEVIRYNQQTEVYKYALVQPKEDEIVLNHLKSKAKKRIDPEKQVTIALSAFEGNGFFILVDDRQLEHLDDKVLITSNTIVSFVKLIALVGG